MGVQIRHNVDVGKTVVRVGDIFSDHHRACFVWSSAAVVDPGAKYWNPFHSPENPPFRQTGRFSIRWLSERRIRPTSTSLLESEGRAGLYGEMGLRRPPRASHQNLLAAPHEMERPKEESAKTGVRAGLVVTCVCLTCFVAVGQPYYFVMMLFNIFCKVTKMDLNVLVGALSEPKQRQLKRFKTNVDILSTTERNICSRFI